jgi:thioredoxin-like negative regulator of GroEL
MKSVSLTEKTKDSFLTALKSSTPTLILYHADWCGHCQAFQPTWGSVKSQLSKEKGIRVAEVEHTNLGNLPANLSRVAGFPTIMIIRSGKPVTEYQGDRSLADVVSFAKKHSIKVEPIVTKKSNKKTKST